MDKIIVKGARENNLKNVNIELPKNKMIVMTGLSGSGKRYITTTCIKDIFQFIKSYYFDFVTDIFNK